MNPGYTYDPETNTWTATGGAEADFSDLHNWTPIGTEGNSFTGVFDGGGHTLSGLYVNYVYIGLEHVYAGLFGFVSSGQYGRHSEKSVCLRFRHR